MRQRITRKIPQQPSMLDGLMNGISNMSAIAAVSGYSAIIGTLTAISILVVSVTFVRWSWNRSDPTGLIKGNALDVVLGDGIATFDSTGFSALCPSGILNFCSELTLIGDQITNINNYLNITNNTAIAASAVGYNGYQPYYTTNVTTIKEAADDTSVRLYDNVISISLTSSRFPAVTFPTDQITIDEDIGRRLRLLETASVTNATTSLPATNVTYSGTTPYYSGTVTNAEQALNDTSTRLYNNVIAISLTSSRFPAVTFPTDQITVDEDVGRRLRLLETAPIVIPDAYTTTFNGSSPQFPNSDTNVGSALVYLANRDIAQQSQITTLQGQTSQLLTRKSLSYYLSVAYGNDITCDGSASLPCASLYRLLQLLPNVTSQYFQISIHFDNGFYQENNFVALKPNIILIGNEGGTLISFYAGLGLDGGSWAATGTGFVSVFRFGSFQCVGLCDFDMSAAVPSGPIFSKFSFYNTTLYANADMLFKRRNDTSSYYAVTMESVVVNAANNIIFQDVTYVSWSLSGDNYATVSFNYNSTSTTGSGQPIVNLNGLVSHNLITVNNYAVGVTVDWSLMDVINRDFATLTRNYVSGATINVHGDVLSLGAINGGLISTGAGSGTNQYLTNDYGLGTTQDTPSDWDTPYPVNGHEADTQLAKRTRILENTVVKRYTGSNYTTGPDVTGSPCTSPINLGTGSAYASGLSTFFASGSAALLYNGTSAGFIFNFASPFFLSGSGPTATVILVEVNVYVNGGVLPYAHTFQNQHTFLNQFIEFNTGIFLNTNDVITMTVSFSSSDSYTACGNSGGAYSSVPYFSFTQFT